ncbi:HD-GYP domain-containing protein [Desulfothermus naphthae]
MEEKEIFVSQLQVGLFIKLNLPWFSHPFMFNSFKIKNQEQIDTIKSLGIKKVIYIPEKSDVEPLSKVEEKTIAEAEKEPQESKIIKQNIEKKLIKIKELKNIKDSLAFTQKIYLSKLKQLNNSFRLLLGKDERGLNLIHEIVKDGVELIFSKSDIVIHLVAEGSMDVEDYSHAINVMILSLLIGKELGIEEEKMEYLGIGALCHDIGKLKIEKKYWRKSVDKMTTSEKDLVRLHPKYGLELLNSIRPCHKDICDIVYQHHERFLGGGFPQGLKGEKINQLSRIVSLANIYDRLCNTYDVEKRLGPLEALQRLFKEYYFVIDLKLFDVMVKVLGIYPPGTIVKLNNGMIGKVLTIRLNDLFRPCLMIYDPDIPKREAVLFDLMEHPDLHIVSSVSLKDLDIKIVRYLDATNRVNFSIDSLDN